MSKLLLFPTGGRRASGRQRYAGTQGYRQSGPKGKKDSPVFSGLRLLPSSDLLKTREEQGEAVHSRRLSENAEAALPNFNVFHDKILKGDVVSAGEILSFLLGITHFQGIESARMYRNLNQTQPDSLKKIEAIFNELCQERNNDCLMLLAQCFGLEGTKAVMVLQHLRAQI